MAYFSEEIYRECEKILQIDVNTSQAHARKRAVEATLIPRLRRLRRAAELSQDELAEKLGWASGQTVSRIERGARGLSVGEFVEWCEACGASPVAVLNGEALTVVPITESVPSGMSE